MGGEIRHFLKIWICFSWQLSIPSPSINSEAADRKQVKTSRRDRSLKEPSACNWGCLCLWHTRRMAQVCGGKDEWSYWLSIALKMCDILKWCKKSDDVPAILKLFNITKHSRASVILSLGLCHSCCLECPSLSSGKFLLSSNSHVRVYRLSYNWPNSLYHSPGCPLLLCRTLITLLLDTYHSAVTSVYMSVFPVKSRALLPTHSDQELHHLIFCTVSLCMLFDTEEVLMSGWRWFSQITLISLV